MSSSPSSLTEALSRLVQMEDLPLELAERVFGELMDGTAGEVPTAALLTALRMKGEAVTEIAGAARAMFARATRVPVQRRGLLDTCGTGGDELQTFNISTAAAIVVAACGVPVAKHGNRSVSSRSGSADVLEQLGYPLGLSAEGAGRCIDQVGLGFCFAPTHHAAMRHVAGVRKALRFRTIFNLLGPLTNPAGAEFQLIGASRVETASRLAQALAELQRPHAYVVCGNNQLDEVSLWGETAAFEVEGGRVHQRIWNAELLGLPECQPAELAVDSPAASAQVIEGILAGQRGPCRDIVLANVAAGLLAARAVETLREGVERGAAAVDSGRAASQLRALIECATAQMPASPA